MDRSEILSNADQAVNGPRRDTYGDATDHFTRVAALWSTELGVKIDADQVTICMMLLKIDRLRETPTDMDGWTDIAGYASLGGEVASKGGGKPTVEAVEMPLPEPIPAAPTGHIEIIIPKDAPGVDDMDEVKGPKRKGGAA